MKTIQLTGTKTLHVQQAVLSVICIVVMAMLAGFSNRCKAQGAQSGTGSTGQPVIVVASSLTQVAQTRQAAQTPDAAPDAHAYADEVFADMENQLADDAGHNQPAYEEPFLQLFPNPTVTTLFLRTNRLRHAQRMMVRVLNANTGAEVLKTWVYATAGDRASLDVSHLHRGQYAILVEAEDALFSDYFYKQ